MLGLELAVVWLVGGWLVLRDARGSEEPLSRFALIYPAAFLVVHGLIWLSALPQFLAAKDGITAAGTPVGSGWYVVACFIAASGLLGLLYRHRRPARTAELT